MKRRSAQYASVGDVLDKMRLPPSVRENIRSHEIWTRWYEIVGHELSRVTSPAEIRGQNLKVHVAHQAWAQQLHFLKPSVMGKIRTICPGANIKDLQFKVGEVVQTEPPVSKELKRKRSNIKPALSERQEMTLRAVEDDKLRQSIREAMEAAADRVVQ